MRQLRVLFRCLILASLIGASSLGAEHRFLFTQDISSLWLAINTFAVIQCYEYDTGATIPGSGILGAHGIFDLSAPSTPVYSAQVVWWGDWAHQASIVGINEHCYYLHNTASRYTGGDANPCWAPYSWARTPCFEARRKEQTPVLLDLGRDGFHLVGLEAGVSFDVDADGHAGAVAWTGGDVNDALLARDLNANGWIDDGSELIGSATLLASGERAANGYEALREFDELSSGGNNDGGLSQADAIWNELLVWIDSNVNGRSEAWELTPLADTSVQRIGFDYLETGIIDSHGNEFRYWSWVVSRGPGGWPVVWVSSDVVFAGDEEQ